MGEVATLRSDGTVAGCVTHINGMYARDEIEKMIVIIVPANGDLPVMAFCNTDSPVEELGLLETAKIQALKTRDILIGE